LSRADEMAIPQRRVSTRRGSAAALDPFGIHSELNLNPSRSSSSTLTIVRVQQPQQQHASTPPLNLNEPPASPVLSQRRLHRSRIAPPSGPPASSEPSNPPGRVSFAFSSFGNNNNPRSSSPSGGGSGRDHGGPPSPSSSPRLRPSSPHSHSHSSFSAGKPRLTPDQLVDLARQATNPKPQQLQGQGPTATDPSSPGVADHAHGVAPATFTPLPDDIYLPFIDRPSEVAALISSPPDAKLFSLLAQTFSTKQPSPEDPAEKSAVAIAERIVELPRDPVQWTYNHLIYHLTRIDRDVAPDPIWAIAARKCVLAHSELIWERVKGGLGVPPELDIDYDFLDDDHLHLHSSGSSNTDDISDDEGRAANGHWSDWDAVMDSPIHARRASKRLSVESPNASLYRKDDEDQVHEPSKEKDMRSPQEHLEHMMVIGNFSPPPVITHHDASPLDGAGADYLSIEPLIAPQPQPSTSFSSLSSNPPPLSLPSSLATGDGLGDIAEGAEEEEMEFESTTDACVTARASPAAQEIVEEDPHLISPSQIQGLRISTSPLPVSQSSGAQVGYGTPPPVLSPISPLPPYPSVPAPGISSSTSTGSVNVPSAPHSRASSFSSIGPFHRSESVSNLSASWGGGGGEGKNYAGSVFSGSEAGDSSGYLSDGDRLPGNPLFPSNFARLAGGPTLRANNPSSRTHNGLPQARYVSSGPGSGVKAKARAYSHGAATSPTMGVPSVGAGVGVAGGSASGGARQGVPVPVPGKRQSWGAGGASGE
ncbi:hypothetical protein B0H34DRAFT_654496, partial [Crassisporium funariophilum]